MPSKTLLSPVEHKILFALGLLICSFYFVNLSNKIVATYNEAVKTEQIEKRKEADNERPISFGFSHCYSPPIYELILLLQFLTVPIIVFLLGKQQFAGFLTSLVLTSLTLFGYICWMIDSFLIRKYSEVFREENISFNTYILYQSTVLEFVLFLAFTILFILHFAILLRFVIEKFHAKIS